MANHRLTVTLVVAALTCAVAAPAQTIRVCDNNPDAPEGDHVYTTLQQAVTAAQSGDIIHVVGSPFGYAGATINKRLTIQGIGVEPDKDRPLLSYVGTLTVTNPTAAGTIVIEGLVIQGNVNFNQSVDDVVIRKCQITGGVGSASIHNNVQIVRNLFTGGNAVVGFTNTTSPMNLVQGNLIVGGGYIYGKRLMVNQNTFVADQNASTLAAVNGCDFCTIQNNIFYGREPANAHSANTEWNNNLLFGVAPVDLPPIGNGNSGGGNLQGADPQFVSLLPQGTNTYSTDLDLHVTAGSPALTASTTDGEVGMYGGSFPYDLTVPLPVIQQLSTTGAVEQGVDLGVTVTAKAN